MNFWPFRKPTASEHASALAHMGHEKRRESIKATTRRIREEIGLPVDERLA